MGADGINSATLQLAWPKARPRRWTEVTCFRGLIPRTVVASLRKADGRALDHNPIDSFSMDRHRTDRSGATTYWVRGGELLNVWIARYEPDSVAFEQEEGDWFPVSQCWSRDTSKAGAPELRPCGPISSFARQAGGRHVVGTRSSSEHMLSYH